MIEKIKHLLKQKNAVLVAHLPEVTTQSARALTAAEVLAYTTTFLSGC
jgi:hypothetical protein